MPVFALYNLNDPTTVAVDSATANGAQNGTYFNGATSDGSQAVLDGSDDIVKLINDPAFQLDRGTLEIQFTLDPAADPDVTRTVLSRDSAGTTQGGYRVEVLPDGAIQITHETATGAEVFSTEPGFYSPGDEINLSYSWILAAKAARFRSRT